MTVNVYILTDSSSTPSNWTEINSAYRNRFPLGGGTALETGGSDSHSTHSGSSVSSVSTVGASEGNYYSTALHYSSSHTHSGSINSISSESHLPSYKDFRCLYRDVSGWNGSLPNESICFCESVPVGFNRFDNGSSYFIRISGTAGGTGGGSSHYHAINVSLDTNSGGNYSGDYANVYISRNHGHDGVSVNSSSANFDYNYWACGLIKTSGSGFVKKDCILLFDGNPGAGWNSLSLTDRFLRVASGNSITTGGTYTSWSHSHTFSGTSSSSNSITQVYNGTQNLYCVDHTHTFSGSLGSESVIPSYVRFFLYQSTKDFGIKYMYQCVNVG